MEEKYKIIRSLGAGATAEVYLVEEIATRQLFAMKIGGQGELLKWEAQLLQSLQSSYFPKVKEYFRENREYLVMEYIDGINLQELLNKEESLEKGEVLYLMEGICGGLCELHKQEPAIIYRDLKPANVMLDKAGKVRLIDLGAACLKDGSFNISQDVSAAVTQAGTYGYAAPEQFWQGVVPDEACDIYAAGKIFAYLLSGKNPAEPPYEVEQFCKGLKGISQAYVEIIERCLQPQPQARYESCESLIREIRRVFDEKSHKKSWKIPQKRTCCYKKCIWKSEYRRIF